MNTTVAAKDHAEEFRIKKWNAEQALEAAIRMALEDFERETGVNATGVNVDFVSSHAVGDHAPRFHLGRVTIRLDD